ncbi:hypothetical protein M271_49025 [Streptomyces rapamycinicus NRRL 5491]|nr:hypothetical protein M271_49025 [Streptomyces rapamycinicus NRRL 5491]
MRPSGAQRGLGRLGHQGGRVEIGFAHGEGDEVGPGPRLLRTAGRGRDPGDGVGGGEPGRLRGDGGRHALLLVAGVPPHRAHEALASVQEIVAREDALDAEVEALRNAGVR